MLEFAARDDEPCVLNSLMPLCLSGTTTTMTTTTSTTATTTMTRMTDHQETSKRPRGDRQETKHQQATTRTPRPNQFSQVLVLPGRFQPPEQESFKASASSGCLSRSAAGELGSKIFSTRPLVGEILMHSLVFVIASIARRVAVARCRCSC